LQDLQRSVCAVSSEGGLFEYGSDEEIAGNLTTLTELTPADTIVDCVATTMDTKDTKDGGERNWS
jgi:hypothetical protein